MKIVIVELAESFWRLRVKIHIIAVLCRIDFLKGLPGLAWAGLGWPGLACAGLGWPELAWAGLG